MLVTSFPSSDPPHQVKCVPFLPTEPVSAFSLDLLPVSYVMHSPVVCLKQRMTVSKRGGGGEGWTLDGLRWGRLHVACCGRGRCLACLACPVRQPLA